MGVSLAFCAVGCGKRSAIGNVNAEEGTDGAEVLLFWFVLWGGRLHGILSRAFKVDRSFAGLGFISALRWIEPQLSECGIGFQCGRIR